MDEILKSIDVAEGDVIILVDACALRHGAKEEVTELVHKTHYPVYSAPMGKGTIDESYDRYGGVCLTTYFTRLPAKRVSDIHRIS